MGAWHRQYISITMFCILRWWWGDVNNNMLHVKEPNAWSQPNNASKHVAVATTTSSLIFINLYAVVRSATMVCKSSSVAHTHTHTHTHTNRTRTQRNRGLLMVSLKPLTFFIVFYFIFEMWGGGWERRGFVIAQCVVCVCVCVCLLFWGFFHNIFFIFIFTQKLINIAQLLLPCHCPILHNLGYVSSSSSRCDCQSRRTLLRGVWLHSPEEA